MIGIMIFPSDHALCPLMIKNAVQYVW